MVSESIMRLLVLNVKLQMTALVRFIKKTFSKWFEQNVSILIYIWYLYMQTLHGLCIMTDKICTFSVHRHRPVDCSMVDDLKYLSALPSEWIKTMTKITCNGYRWHIKKNDKRSEMQNSGVLVNSCTDTGDIAYHWVELPSRKQCYLISMWLGASN